METIITPATNVIAENAGGTAYKATIDGQVWSGIHSKSRFWENVQKAIEEGAEVTPSPIKGRDEILAEVIGKIDAKTYQSIIGGFPWKGKTLSSSESAQANFLALEQVRQRGALTFPLPWSTKGGEGFLIANEAEWLELLNTKDMFVFFTAKQGGQSLRTIVSTMTVEELKAWVDPR